MNTIVYLVSNPALMVRAKAIASKYPGSLRNRMKIYIDKAKKNVTWISNTAAVPRRKKSGNVTMKIEANIPVYLSSRVRTDQVG